VTGITPPGDVRRDTESAYGQKRAPSLIEY